MGRSGPLWLALVLGCIGVVSLGMALALSSEANNLSYLHDAGLSWTEVAGEVQATGSRLGTPTATVRYEPPPGATRPETAAGQSLPMQEELYAPAETDAAVEVLVDPNGMDAFVRGAPLQHASDRRTRWSRLGRGVGMIALLGGLLLGVGADARWRGQPQPCVLNPGRHQL